MEWKPLTNLPLIAVGPAKTFKRTKKSSVRREWREAGRLLEMTTPVSEEEGWAVAMIGAEEEPHFSSGSAGSVCPVWVELRFLTVTITVTKSRCTSCSRPCESARQAALRVADGLRGESSQRCTLRYVAQVVSDLVSMRAWQEGSGSGVGSMSRLIHHMASPNYGLAVLVLAAVEPVTSGGAHWAYAYGCRGSTAAFLTDVVQRTHSDVFVSSAVHSSSPSSSTSPRSPSPRDSPLGSTQSSSHTSPRSASDSPRFGVAGRRRSSASSVSMPNDRLPSDRNSYSTSPISTSPPSVGNDVDPPMEATCGALVPGNVFLMMVETMFRSLAVTSSSPRRVVSSPKWKRASAAPQGWGETVRSLAKGFLSEFDEWEPSDRVGDALESFITDRILSKRPDVSVCAVTVPGPASLMPNAVFGGRLFENATEHVPLGVLVVQIKSQVILFVRTIPFGSLECTPHENHVSLYLSRGQDSLGDSYVTKWDNVKKTSIDEVSGSTFHRIVLLPVNIDPESQVISILDNIVRVEYNVLTSSAQAGGPGTTGGPGGGGGGSGPLPVALKLPGRGRRSIFKKKE